ncbi:MAG: hypothetical protein A2Y00_07115 [Omnitrophica WOR_2 bacterium GWF2_43_52]|nr:MAG: hypothetical protein A2Y00_07115 [Omnitrophica WOR_2 bacterium GWF2_43_52]OGX58026.1 MAG: hypothetical protein A2460_02020 [Omnitrophica WOR_2 bacterium RIFOXYC2_FULL_43_9]HAH19317.1 hypothetical protein [Candidatus Omnitrophota bacterium]HBG63660.1 hypothetical protein [Candidatus Omnitrophota bacterium]HCD38587.1 hypothetical protein [Candidatus Omnitrophota bacterium]
MYFIARNNVKLSMATIVRTFFDRGLKKEICGNYIQEFQRRFAEYAGVKYAVGVSSARIGLYAVLKLLHLHEGDEVIMSAYNFSPVPLLVKLLKCNPVFVDIKKGTPNIDVEKIENALGPKTKIILVSHMCGYPVAMERVMKLAEKHKVCVIEDCAHALGATYKGRMAGSFGDFGIYSFGYGKMMPCFGGGMITLKDERYYAQLLHVIQPVREFSLEKCLATLFFYLFSHKYIFPWTVYPFMRLNPGFGDRAIQEKDSYSLEPYLKNKYGISAFQAKAGILQLKNIAATLQSVRRNSEVLNACLKNLPGVNIASEEKEGRAAYLYYRLVVKNREHYRRILLKGGIDIKVDSMCTPSDLYPFLRQDGNFRNSEDFKKNNIEIPNGPSFSLKHMEYIVSKIKEVSVYQG